MAIGIPKNYFFDSVDAEVEGLFYQFLESLKSLGYRVFDIELQNTGKYYNTWKDIRYAEASEVHAQWLKTRMEDYSEEVRKMLVLNIQIRISEGGLWLAIN